MKTFLRAAVAALAWPALAHAQLPPPALPPPPAPLPPPPAPPPAPLAPASGGVTDVRSPDTPAPIDQGPDTLPSLDEEPVPAAPAPPPPKKRSAKVRPVRAERRIALLAELGWNGLAGFGAIVSYHANPHLTFDLGAGLAVVGGKIGFRTRYNFFEGPVTPVIGVGILGATGWDAPSQDLSDDENEELNIRLRPSAFVQAVVGIDWTTRGGFTLLGTVGHAWLVSKDNVIIITGEPTPEEQEALDIVFSSGAVISVAIGYSFR